LFLYNKRGRRGGRRCEDREDFVSASRPKEKRGGKGVASGRGKKAIMLVHFLKQMTEKGEGTPEEGGGRAFFLPEGKKKTTDQKEKKRSVSLVSNRKKGKKGENGNSQGKKKKGPNTAAPFKT